MLTERYWQPQPPQNRHLPACTTWCVRSRAQRAGRRPGAERSNAAATLGGVPTPIADAADPRLADYVRLRDVDLRKSLESEHGLFLAEGEKVIRRAIAA